LRIILFINTAVSRHDCLDPGHQAIAGLRHGVPVEGPHHLLYLLDQILGFVARLCIGPQLRFAPLKKIKIFYTSLRFSLNQYYHLLLSWTEVLEDVMLISRYQSASFDTISSKICSGKFIFCSGGGGPAEVPGDELVQAGGQDGSLSSC
jgi:hypothetical protein